MGKKRNTRVKRITRENRIKRENLREKGSKVLLEQIKKLKPVTVETKSTSTTQKPRKTAKAKSRVAA